MYETSEYVARQLLQLKSSTMFITFLTTLWMGNNVMLAWDNLNNRLMNMWGVEDLEDEEYDILNKIVYDYVIEHEEIF